MKNEQQYEITHEGVLSLGEFEIPCFVLKNGERVLSTMGMQKALGVIGNEPNQRSSGRLDEILSSEVVKSLLSSDNVSSNYTSIQCFKGNKRISAYRATMLPDICELMLKVRDYAKDNNVKLGIRQKAVIIQSDIIIRALAKIGIIALVDEVTGYQYDRERFELQSILQTFISEEIFKWQETFQLSFYKEIFRLWDVPFTADNIKRKPMFIGKLTSELVYKNLPKGVFVLNKLKEKTPITESGNYKYRLHQSLTPEVGREALKKVIYSVEALASISDSKLKFLNLMKEKYNPDLQLNLFTELDNLASKEDKKEVILKNEFNKNLEGLLKVPPPKKEK